MNTLAAAPALLDHTQQEPTLDELLARVWEGLSECAVVECPVCGGQMDPERPVGGRCHSCGSALA